MTIRKLYMSDESSGGDGENPLPVKKLKGLSPAERRDWNDMLDSMQKDGVSGSKDLDQPDKSVGSDYIEKYKKENPGSSVSSDMVDRVRNDHQNLRSGESFADMTPEQTRILRKQMNPDYLSRPVPEGPAFGSSMSRMYYPEFKRGAKNYGTDAEGYFKDFAARPKEDIGGVIPKPNYKSQTSRNLYLNQWVKKYGDLQKRGDTVLRVDEIPKHATHSSKKMAESSAKQYGIDPALLYSSAMEEGMSGLFPDSKGQLNTGYQQRPEGYTVDGNFNFGLDNFHDFFPELKKKGYLPKNFDYSKLETLNEQGKPIRSAFFKNVEDAVKAKAAVMKLGYDYVDEQAKKHDINLSKNARDFFALAWLNGGEGGVLKRLVPYSEKGYLEEDKFMKHRPKEEESVKNTKNDVYGHVIPRLQMRDNLIKEKLFDNGDTD